MSSLSFLLWQLMTVEVEVLIPVVVVMVVIQAVEDLEEVILKKTANDLCKLLYSTNPDYFIVHSIINFYFYVSHVDVLYQST